MEPNEAYSHRYSCPSEKAHGHEKLALVGRKINVTLSDSALAFTRHSLAPEMPS